MPRKSTSRKAVPTAAETTPTAPEVAKATAAPERSVAPATESPSAGPVLVTAETKSVKPLVKAAAAASATASPAAAGSNGPNPNLQDAIRRRAFEIYKERGSSGSAVEDWLRAEREVKAGQSARKPA